MTTLRSIADDHDRDGVEALRAALARRAPDARWLDELVEGASDPRTSVAATWLLLEYARRGAELGAARTRRLLDQMPSIEAPFAQQHVCQAIEWLDVPEDSAAPLAEFLRNASRSAHKFLRAWAMDGLHRLSLQHRDHRAAASRALARGERDDAASVRARARRIRAELDR